MTVKNGRKQVTQWFKDNVWIGRQHPSDIKNDEIRYIAVFSFPQFILETLRGETSKKINFQNEYTAEAGETEDEALWKCAVNAYKYEMDYSVKRQLPLSKMNKNGKWVVLKGNMKKVDNEGERIYKRYFI